MCPCLACTNSLTPGVNMKTAPMMVVMVSCTASRPYTFLMNPDHKIRGQ